jgi:hypothetical protein
MGTVLISHSLTDSTLHDSGHARSSSTRRSHHDAATLGHNSAAMGKALGKRSGLLSREEENVRHLLYINWNSVSVEIHVQMIERCLEGQGA